MQDLTQPQPAGRTLWLTDVRIVIGAWAVLVAAVAVGIYHHRQFTTELMMQSRATGVASAIDVLDHGGPPLLGSDVPYHPGISSSHLFPAGATDDQGIYLYLPLLGHWTGEHDPGVLMTWFFSGCFVLLLLLLPFVVYGLFRSLAAAFVAPLLVLWNFTLTGTDLYWVQAWSLLLGIPVLLLVHRWWTEGRRRRVVAALVPLMVAAGFATSIRSQSGLPILVAALGLVLLAGASLRGRVRRDWLVRGGIAAALVVAYLSVSLAFVAVRAYRDSRVDLSAASQPSSHPFWHPAYLGLGYLPNKYGITWNDAVAIDAVERARPGTRYLSGTYESTLRHLYLKLVAHDPLFALRTYGTKAWAILDDALRRFWLAPLLLAAALALRRPRRLLVATWLLLPAAVIGAASPLLAIPVYTYELGWLGAVGVAWLLAVCWAVARAEALVRSRRHLRLARAGPLPRSLRGLSALGVAAGAAVLAATGALAAAGGPAVPVTSYLSAEPLVSLAALKRPAALSWRFHGGLPARWRAASGAQLQPDYGETDLARDRQPELGLHVTTTTTPNADELTGPTVSLEPGRYAVVGRVRILAGGMRVIVRDANEGRPLAGGKYAFRQSDFLDHAVETRFRIVRPKKVRLALVNWTAISNASSWVLWGFEIQRLDASPLYNYYRNRAAPLARASSLKGSTVAAWSFRRGLPPGWTPESKVQRTRRAQGLAIVTNPQRFAYQLLAPSLRLPPGRYAAVVDGRIADGGLEIGILDVKRNAWIETSNFYDHERPTAGRKLATTATLAAPTRVQVVLSNWAPWTRSSQWFLEHVRLVRLP